MAWNEPSGDNKDPWGNRKNNEQGPPDLDELLKKAQDGLKNLIGKNSPRKKPEQDNMPNKQTWVIGLILLVIWLGFGFYTVQPAEKGVVLRFGQYLKTTDSGLNWHIPYPVERVYKVNVTEIRSVNHAAHMLTKDENIVRIGLVVQYQVADAKDFLFNVRDPDKTLHDATESALREQVGSTKMDAVLTSGRTELAVKTQKLIQDIVDRYVTGLVVSSVNLQEAQPPQQVQASFDDAIKAREDEERHKNKAEAYANEVEQKASGVADRLTQEAEAYKSQVVLLAKGESSRFSQVRQAYEQAPDVTRSRLYLETMEFVLSNSSKIMVDVDQSNPLLWLPLDKMLGEKTRVQHQEPDSLQQVDIEMDKQKPEQPPQETVETDERGRSQR